MKWTSSMKKCRAIILQGKDAKIKHPTVYDKVMKQLSKQCGVKN